MLNLTPKKTCKNRIHEGKSVLAADWLGTSAWPSQSQGGEHPRDLQYLRCDDLTHRIHGTDIGGLIFIVNVGTVNIPYMDPTGYKSTLFLFIDFRPAMVSRRDVCKYYMAITCSTLDCLELQRLNGH